MTSEQTRYGWESNFDEFKTADPKHVQAKLAEFIADASPEQLRAWKESIPPLQGEVNKSIVKNSLARDDSAILEYLLPMESRRPDVIMLVGESIMIVELKGKTFPSQADIDQVAAYARDLRNYHRECASREVYPVLVPTLAKGDLGERGGVRIVGPDTIHKLVDLLAAVTPQRRIARNAFLADEAYCPLPTLVEAARELMFSGTLRTIDRAHAATQPAVDEITRIVHQAYLTKSRHLILLTGVPGAGKTLVGLQTVHARYLDDLAVSRASGKPTAPAVFLSGNGPLVKVLQYEMKRAGGDGKTFVRDVKDYVKQYSKRSSPIPPEHVLVFDEAQRAFDADKMRKFHKIESARSEPEEFIGFADRVPEWCVVIALIGSGQEIHEGEEAGVEQWKVAIERSPRAKEWSIHLPETLEEKFKMSTVSTELRPELNLTKELRFHQVEFLHRFVAELLKPASAKELRVIAKQMESVGFHLRITRNLDTAKDYLRNRYEGDSDARFGMIASSRDKSLPTFGIFNDYQSTKRMQAGPWYGDSEDAPQSQSCRLLASCMTEFGAQGLELDAALLAWGTDLRLKNGAWINDLAAGYSKRSLVKNALQLRMNSYRVLLTRGRDGTVIFVPQLTDLDETYGFLTEAGFLEL